MAYNLQLAERLRAILKGTKTLEEKKLFGGVGFLLHGNMACGVHEDELILRLSARDFEAALKRKNTRIFDISGRPMQGWLLVARAGWSSDKALQEWVRQSLAFAGSLPPK